MANLEVATRNIIYNYKHNIYVYGFRILKLTNWSPWGLTTCDGEDCLQSSEITKWTSNLLQTKCRLADTGKFLKMITV